MSTYCGIISSDSPIFFYVEGRWSEAEVERLDINALELAAMNIGSFTFLEEARRRGVSISHLCEFTDNTSAEYAADRGKPSSARLTELVTRRYDALYDMGVSGACERVASVDNDIADGLITIQRLSVRIVCRVRVRKIFGRYKFGEDFH